jgi:hypothetical protein
MVENGGGRQEIGYLNLILKFCEDFRRYGTLNIEL